MKLDFIPLGKLCVSKANMRHGRKAPDVGDILPTIRARGVLQPLIVRAGEEPGMFEIVGGARRFHAASLVARERAEACPADPPDPDPLPCAILEGGDAADAVEASLIENIARLDPDEVTRWETFTRLIRAGRSPADIAATFGLPDLMVARILALGNLLPRIRDLYRREQIDAATVRHLTLATKRQQRDWLALRDDPKSWCPTGHQLKSWLFGGGAVAVEHALFDVAASGLAVVADLFGEERYFADNAGFWTAQNAAVEARRAAYLEEGWSDAVVIGPDSHFQSWEYEKAPKRKGGRVYIDVSSRGEVRFHEGYLTRREAERLRRGEAGGSDAPAKLQRPELTATLQRYVNLHRHAAVRAALLDHHGIALRLMVAHLVVGSPLWTVRPEPQTAPNAAVAESVAACRGEQVFDAERRAVLALLGFDAEQPSLIGGNGDPYRLVSLFLALCDLDDAQVGRVIAVAMGECLASGSAAVAAAGAAIGIDMADWWEADAALFEPLRDRQLLGAVFEDVAGEIIANANAKEKGAVIKGIIADCLSGSNGRSRVARWVPRWMAFPPAAYTARGGVGSVAAHALVEAARADRAASDAVAPAGAAIGSEADNGRAGDAAECPAAGHDAASDDDAPCASASVDPAPATADPDDAEADGNAPDSEDDAPPLAA
ncbi:MULTISPECIES: ParB/RepB/Spo0J family partition protein [unclassified Sphingomonas]|uniref:ParB/RepB/Spo0J family partition protein n=1 Tax=unclassified Sphingomonas TaxID=196159 RepID=UPI0021506F47|nr:MULTISPECIES: ParB N-terminal domain-containing protein [unclassified Sphingomonas]MCR5869496.1 ParB N-terminal domain-containing protein [Sphingomonas sp. J344]UUX98779.1 ParB N-terminal domain-containing protein [Sphingomonas sp. J315]